jgi:lysophospholipase L1-like esterase
MLLLLQTVEEADPPQVQRSLFGRRKYLYIGILVLLVLGAIEAGLKFLYSLRDKEPTAHQQVARITPYANLDWPKEYFAEQSRTKNQFVPYLMWRHQEFHGKHLNISPEGLRRTWNPPVSEGQVVKKVFCFGGSTTWGVGARDDFTIPSLLSKKLNRETARYVVVNYGEQGYTLTQEVMSLVLLLKQGNIPDYVIFYDGINEVMVGTSNNKPGSIFGADNIRRLLFKRERETFWTKFNNELRRTSIFRGIGEVRDLVRPYIQKPKSITPEKDKALQRLADDIVQDYIRNVEVVKHLAQAYGFQYLFFWQPALCTNQALTAEEKKLPAWTDRKMVKMYQLVYDRMDRFKMPHFYNIANMFDQKKKTLYFSWAHLTEEGNNLVAERISQIFKREFPSKISTQTKKTPDPS